jgi:hypothetical protein
MGHWRFSCACGQLLGVVSPVEADVAGEAGALPPPESFDAAAGGDAGLPLDFEPLPEPLDADRLSVT